MLKLEASLPLQWNKSDKWMDNEGCKTRHTSPKLTSKQYSLRQSYWMAVCLIRKGLNRNSWYTSSQNPIIFHQANSRYHFVRFVFLPKDYFALFLIPKDDFVNVAFKMSNRDLRWPSVQPLTKTKWVCHSHRKRRKSVLKEVYLMTRFWSKVIKLSFYFFR